MDLRDVAGKLFGGSGFEQLDDPVVLGVVDRAERLAPVPQGELEQPEPVDAQELLEEGAGFQLKVRLMEGQIDAVVLVVGNVLGAGVHPGVEILQAGNVLRRYAGGTRCG